MSRARVLIGLRDLGLGRQDYGHGLGVNGWDKPQEMPMSWLQFGAPK
jgi:hypothetical protein